jgi:DNA polymerase
MATGSREHPEDLRSSSPRCLRSLGAAGNVSQINAGSIAKIAVAVKACRACPLSITRKNAVPGEGGGMRGIIFVGEAPGAKEDAQGRPFVGQAGRILNGLLKKNGMLREEVFITNVVKCRPPKNRPPKCFEAQACSPYLERQIALLGPRLICPMGNSATRALLDPKANITDMHGRIFDKDGRRFMPLYHPAAILYNRKLMKEMEKDFEQMGLLMEE